MSYILLPSSGFVRAARRITRKNRVLQSTIDATLAQLAENPNARSLETHRLKGRLRNSWSCSAGYDLRIIFSFGPQPNTIVLESIGTHDQVY